MREDEFFFCSSRASTSYEDSELLVTIDNKKSASLANIAMTVTIEDEAQRRMTVSRSKQLVTEHG